MGLECGSIKGLVGMERECRVGNRGYRESRRCGEGRVAADF